MNFLPVVSIITPSYNQAQFIEETILSIKGQTYKNFEHIVVDGGSTDNTLEILGKYEETYNLMWSSEPDGGMYQAINKGFRKAKGDILCYLNTDDLYLPWTLEAVVRHFSENRQVDLLYGDIINLDDNKGTMELTFCPPFQLNGGGLYQPSVFWSRRIYERVGDFDEGLQIGGDYEYWLRMAVHGSIKKINEFLAVDRHHDGRKGLVQVDLSGIEVSQIRKRYGIPVMPGKADRFAQLFKRYLWTRLYMALFIFQYLKSCNNRSGCWQYFLQAGDVHLPSMGRLLLRFLPFIGKRVGPWLAGGLPVGHRKGNSPDGVF